ncbi:MAG: hypothetical protein J5I93_29120 [Pirellulaceae bacterium]|nr:hypothetical protein [Pirellulaceae bacterium]
MPQSPVPSPQGAASGTQGPASGAQGKGWLTILAVTSALLIFASILLALPIGFFGPVIVVGGLFFTGLVGFHYLVWGRWLTRIVQEEETGDK